MTYCCSLSLSTLRERSCSAVCFSADLRRPRGGLSQLPELQWLFAADLQRLTHACLRPVKTQAVHAAVSHSHIIWRLPSALLALTQPTACFSSDVFTITPTRCCNRLHLPNIRRAAYFYLFIVLLSQEVIIHVKQLLDYYSGRNSQLMIKKWQLASFLCRIW